MVTNYRKLNTYARYFRPGIVDIMPTLARFMDIDMDAEKRKEVDGIPLIGTVSLADIKLNYFQRKIDVSWQALEQAGVVKIWISKTNNFKAGGKDTYILQSEVPLTQQHTTIDVKDLPSAFYKVLLEAPGGYFNKWIVLN